MDSIDLKNFKEYLGKGHVLYTMIEEHEIILGFLDELEKLNNNLQKSEIYEMVNSEIEALKVLINHIIDAEPHHQREEKILFTELEYRAVIGPPQMMRWEHQEIRQYKHNLRDFVSGINKENFVTGKNEINRAVRQLVSMLRDHISKENNILYPMALKFIPEPEKWKEMKISCDEIGYCSFTPVFQI